MNITDPIRRYAESMPDAMAAVSDQRPDISYGDLDAMIDGALAAGWKRAVELADQHQLYGLAQAFLQRKRFLEQEVLLAEQ